MGISVESHAGNMGAWRAGGNKLCGKMLLKAAG
jgi:hypothetical protein